MLLMNKTSKSDFIHSAYRNIIENRIWDAK